uniref:CRAL-TRIO domain-containing protein n=1 Tax=Timema bartmani TaxID=61472 RepID=A0A7R9FAS7_9NEOP|nr:unnamed protein product [Timema bartmani]
MIPMPGVTDKFTQTVISRYVGTEDQHYDLNQFIKMAVMIGELLLIDSCSLDFHAVVDLNNYSLGVIKQFTPVILKKIQVLITKAYPLRLKSIQLVNAPAFVDKLVTVLKMVLNPKLFKRDLIFKRDWFLEQENISSDEEKRPGKPLDQSELFGMEGSFMKLSVD